MEKKIEFLTIPSEMKEKRISLSPCLPTAGRRERVMVRWLSSEQIKDGD